MHVLFLCLARNCEATLPVFFSYLENCEQHGLSCRAIIGENGSVDGTRRLIENAVGRRIALLDTSLMERAPSRLVRMALGRQALLDAAFAGAEIPDYVCVLDVDNVMLVPPQPEALLAGIEQLRQDSRLFAVGATSRPVYYDLLALRMQGHDYSNLNTEIAAAKKHPLSYFRFHEERIYSNQRLMTRPEPIVCESCFNGLCLYNSADYQLGTYRAENEADVCEHVTCNLTIGGATGKHMLISPDLAVQAPADHVPVGFGRFWMDRIKERF